MKLENWSHSYADDELYKSPETRSTGVSGIITGHPRFEDGKIIITSHVVEAGPGYIITNSGSRYELGEPDPDWLIFLEENDIPFNPENPFS